MCASALAQQRPPDSELSETLSWMDNSYNSHPGVSGAYGHGRTGWTHLKTEVLTRKFWFPALMKHLHTMAAK
jgi:hypothetical protein